MRIAVLSIGVCLAALELLAHHEFSSEYDEKKPVTLKGIVSNVEWSDPHVYVSVDVPAAGGDVVTWAVEFASPLDLKKAGWTRNFAQVGEAITAEGSAARDGSHRAGGKVLILAGGKRLSEPSEAQLVPSRPRQSKATPRWPDGHPRLGPEPGQTGYWSYPSAST